MKTLTAITLVACATCLSQSAAAWDNDILISTPNTSLMVSCNDNDQLRFFYYGPRITDTEKSQAHGIWSCLNRAAYPEYGRELEPLTSIAITHADGNPSTWLCYDSHESRVTDKGTLTVVHLKDPAYATYVDINYLAYTDIDIIETWVEVINKEKKPITLRRVDAGCLPVRRGDTWLAHLHGNWAAETHLTTEKLERGVKSIKNYDGARNSHYDHPEVMISLDGEPQETTGRVIGAALAWSGDYELRIETNDETANTLYAGQSWDNAQYSLLSNTTFTTPRLAITYSDEGMSGVSRNFHRYARNGALHAGDKMRDILLNSWEGVYLDVDHNKMVTMMQDFADLGGELFVMDDGWFGVKYPRIHDNSALGDWVVDTNKLPNGIEGLVAAAKDAGIKFGIWIEPECTNTLSELYEQHPDWVLKAPNRDLRLTRGGTQLLLDMANPEVQQFVFSVVDKLMTDNPDIAYIKWDANTNAINLYSQYLPKEKALQTNIDYHRGLKSTLKRIREKYPDLTIQACGGGGGRVNYGTMPYFDEVWVSDNTDALQRLFMQWGTSMFYPSMCMAQHVSASPNHQTGRSLPLKFRFDVAMTGRLGMEMVPASLTDEEKDFARKAIADYKAIRPIVQLGDQYRLISPYEGRGVASLMYVTADKNEAVFFAYKYEHYRNQLIPRFKAAGLDPEATYEIVEINVPAGQNPSFLNGQRATGQLLMDVGFEIPLGDEYASRVYRLKKVD